MRRVQIEVTELYRLTIGDDEDGTDAVTTLDEMDSDDAAGHYQSRAVTVTDEETGAELPVVDL